MSLLYFLSGIIFIMYIIPFLDGVSTYVLTWIETKKAIQTAKIYQIKQTIEINESDTKIGFVYQEKEEEE